MAVKDLSTIVRGWKGRLIKDPTNLSAASPYGGTVLGAVAGQKFITGLRHGVIVNEHQGGATNDVVYSGESVVIECVLRGWDADAIAAVNPNTSASGSTIDYLVAGAGKNRPGYTMGNQSMALLFEPDDTANNRMILFRKCVALPKAAMELQMKLKVEAVIAAVFYAVPDSTGRCAHVGLKANLTI